MTKDQRKSPWKNPVRVVALAATLVFFAYAFRHAGQSELGQAVEREWAPGTVLAEIDGHVITLADLEERRNAKLVGLDEGYAIDRHVLLELMVRQRMLFDAAEKAGIEETEEYLEMVQRLRENPGNEWMSEEELRERALGVAYLEKAIEDNLIIEEEDLQEMFAIFQPSMPEGTAFEEVRHLLENKLKRQFAERHIQSLLYEREFVLNDEWVGWAQEQAARQNHGRTCACCP